jgi:hypothetical protein
VGVHEYPGVEQQRWAAADVKSAAKQMLHVFQEPERTKTLGLLGRERIQKQYSPDVVGRAMVCALRDFLNSKVS